MRAWFIGIVALSLAFVGVTGASLADTQEEDPGLAVFLDEDGEVHTKEMTKSQLDHFAECTWDLTTNACDTGVHDATSGFFITGFFIPSGTTVGDFQTTLVGENSGATVAFYCSFSYIEGSPAPGTPGLNCEVQESDWPYNEEFTHECFAYPYNTIGVLPAGGAPGWVNQPEDSTTCFVDHGSFF